MEQLSNLAKIGEIHIESADASEFSGLVESARDRLLDLSHHSLSDAGRFDLAYNAAHALALAALRWHGFRSVNRYQVFQCLVHTVNLSAEKPQVFAQCHRRRNIAEYEGHLEIGQTVFDEYVALVNELLKVVDAMNPIA